MKIVESNGKFKSIEVEGIYDQLPLGVYILKFDLNEGGFFLQRKEYFVLPRKIYGDHSITQRWIKSWNEVSEKNMGIILSGLKGSGKTITAQMFCIEIQKPVIIISDAFQGSNFVDYITKYRDVVIFIDEFEKVYFKPEESTDLLGIMDGLYATRLIFILTVNNFTINKFLINRLGRVKYRKHYENLERSVIDAVIDDLLVNKEHTESIHKFLKKVNMCTFDLLVNVIKEMNAFGETALECSVHLNLEPEHKTYDIYEKIDGKEIIQASVNLMGDQEEFEISRNEISTASREEYIKRRADGDDDVDSDEYWTLHVDFKECTLKEFGDNLQIIGKDDSFKIVMKERRYSMFAI